MANPLKQAAMRWAYASVNGVRVQIPWDENKPQYGKYHFKYSKGSRQEIIAYTEGNCNLHDREQIQRWMKGENPEEIHVGIDCSGFVYRTLEEALSLSGSPPLAETLGVAAGYANVDTLTGHRAIERACDVQAGNTMRFAKGIHSGVILETVYDSGGKLQEIWYGHSSYTRGPHIGWIQVNDPWAPINDQVQEWHDQMWDYLKDNNLRDLYFTSVHESPFYRGPRPRVIKDGGVLVYFRENPVLFEVAPYIWAGRVFCHYRNLAEAMGATFQWNETTQEVTVVLSKRTVKCQVGSEVGIADGQGVFLDEPPVFVGESASVAGPLRFIAEGLGCRVDWDAGARVARLRPQ